VDDAAIEEVHRIYMSIVSHGTTTDQDAEYLRGLARHLCSKGGAQVIAVAGTEFSLVLRENIEDFPMIDCARPHMEEIVKRAVS
jgi:aspartate/glutamate racemase